MKRENMINNFNRAKDPKFTLEHYLEHSNMGNFKQKVN